MPAASRDCCSDKSVSSDATDTGAVHTTSPVAVRVMRARTSHDRSLFCNSPLTHEIRAAARRLVGGAAWWRRHADIFDLRQSIGQPRRHVCRHGGDLAVAVGGGDRHHRNGRRSAPEDSELGPTIAVTTASPTIDAEACNGERHGPRRPNRRDGVRGFGGHAASAGEAAAGNRAGGRWSPNRSRPRPRTDSRGRKPA